MRMAETTSPCRCNVTLGGGQFGAGEGCAAGPAVEPGPLAPGAVLAAADGAGLNGNGLKPSSGPERIAGPRGTKVSDIGWFPLFLTFLAAVAQVQQHRHPAIDFVGDIMVRHRHGVAEPGHLDDLARQHSALQQLAPHRRRPVRRDFTTSCWSAHGRSTHA